MKPENPPPQSFHPHHPHNCRRAKFHNYKAPGYYMITINKALSLSEFSHIIGDLRSSENSPSVNLTKIGEIIDLKINEICQYPEFDIPNYVIMPDHVHLLWHVKEWLPRDLGHYVAYLKAQSTALWRQENAHIPNIANFSLFEPKFNDKISFTDEMTHRFSNYISDNPRRRLTILTRPELFSRVHRVRILEYEMDFYGNFQLLKHPIIAAAVVSSRYTPEERIIFQNAWEEAIRTQSVLVSPFISKEEKELQRKAIEEGASIIRIIPDGLGPKYKPSGQEFDLCAEGRCLHLGLPRPSSHTDPIRRQFCLNLNAIAHWIASHPAERMTLRPNR